MIKLIKPDKNQIDKILGIYFSGEGNYLNETLTNLFLKFDRKDKYEDLIKAVSINQIYSTAILNINPVVDKIFEIIPSDKSSLTIKDYIQLVDQISEISWVDKKGQIQNRCNLSFSSKYIHFLSNRSIPIYDSYVWILICGYLNQYCLYKIRKKRPSNYKEFYDIYNTFINTFNLKDLDIYKIDKYLWQYCHNMLTQLSKDYNIDLNKAKPLLIKLIKQGEEPRNL